jgi:hypothetical protein
VIVAFRAKPPTPPSSAASVDAKHEAKEKKLTFGASIKQFFTELFQCFKEVYFIILLLGYGLGYGAIQSLLTLINQITIPEGYNTDQAGWFGVGTFVIYPLIPNIKRERWLRPVQPVFIILLAALA